MTSLRSVNLQAPLPPRDVFLSGAFGREAEVDSLDRDADPPRPSIAGRECLSVGVDLVADGSDVLGRLVGPEAEDRPSLGQQADP